MPDAFTIEAYEDEEPSLPIGFTVDQDPDSTCADWPSIEAWENLNSWKWYAQLYKRADGRWTIHGKQPVGNNAEYKHTHTADTLGAAIAEAHKYTLLVIENEAAIKTQTRKRRADKKKHKIRF